ncbi:MAG: head-tail connector protein [Lentisphaeria bacterium]
MKVSDIGLEEMCQFLRIDLRYLSDEDGAILGVAKSSAIAYVSGYTGLTADELDEYDDITIAVLVLISDMFDNRQMYVDKSSVNRVTDSILGMHCTNLLG